MLLYTRNYFDQAEQLSEKFKALFQASKTSSEILKKRVKAETQKTRLRYVKARAALEKQKAAVDIDIGSQRKRKPQPLQVQN